MGAHPTAESPIVEGFERHVRDRGDDEALRARGGRAGGEIRRTFGELAERVGEWQRRLPPAAGPLAADRPVALGVGNVAAFVEIYLALRRLDVPLLALDGALSLADQVRICRRLGVERLLSRHPPGDGDQDAAEDLGEGVWLHRPAVETPGRVPAGVGLVKLTSGSTGAPVGACFTDAGLHVGIRQIGAAMEIRESDRVFLAIPVSHSYGFDNGVLSLAVLGTTLILERRIFPADLLRGLAETDATFLPLVPPLVRSLGQSPWPDDLALRRVICAGGRLLPAAAREFRAASGLPVHDFYGSTETGGICFESAPEDPAAAGTVGKPLPGVRVELGDDGAVTVHSDANLVGHLGPIGEEEEDVADGPDGARLRPRPVQTGDLAEWTPEGRLRLVGRNAEILKVGGRKVAVAEMESALEQVDGIREAAVVGVDDPVRGERSVAFLVTDRWPVDVSSLPSRLAPREVRRAERLPHTARGKLDRAALRRLARPRSAT